jgi:hypothetical protein
MTRPLTIAFALLVLLVPSAAAQGSDNCAIPTPINGVGTFAFNNASATAGTQGQSEALCNYFGSTVVNHDVWFTWMAPSGQEYELTACSLTGVDTKIAVYDGAGCPTGPAIACNDDSCGFQSRLTFTTQPGQMYTLQIGTFPSASGGSGSFSIDVNTTPSCAISTGPDVIVGDLLDVGNYAASGPLEALVLGTTACNVGTAPVPWQAGTNHHPVIGGNFYRYKLVDGAGRFEQIGMSWLKHGFAAVSGTFCCPCQGGGGGLGVGCSDPYSSGLNGNQAGLGPRWQVDAHTGIFAYPPANPPWSGTTARRIEVLLSDLEPSSTGTLYFGESQYVTPEDSQAGNQNNNASWRAITATGGGSAYTFAFNGSTQRMQSAIRAWQEVDPQVQLTDVQVPDDGLVVVGSRAYDLGGGVWRYEYAVYNMNSHRSIGRFTVPIPFASIPSNLGFHGVTYRNGDGPGNQNMSDAPWSSPVNAADVTWFTESEAQNTRANAIRWGTTYNFRFDSTHAPVNGTVSFGLWRGSLTGPASREAAAVVPGPNSSSQAVCFGDGTGAPCPCGNNGGPGQGCAHSLGGGGTLAVSGAASIAADTLLLSGSGMPDSSCLYFQGTTLVAGPGGPGAPFGDGLRCAGGFSTRLGTKQNVGGASQFPEAGDASVSVQGACSAGDSRVYQVWYRNSASFCTPDTFNTTGAWQLTWQP